MTTDQEKLRQLHKEYDILISLKKETEEKLDLIKLQIFSTLKKLNELRGYRGTINRS